MSIAPVALRPVIAANWKANLTMAKAEELALGFADSIFKMAEKFPNGEVPFQAGIFATPKNLSIVGETLAGFARRHELTKPEDVLFLGVQNTYPTAGAFTGQYPAEQVNADFEFMGYNAARPAVLIGHSEPRYSIGSGETEAFIAEKMVAAILHGLQPFLCIGESLDARERNLTENELKRQLGSALATISAEQFVEAKTVLAYEPIWAIGTGKTATPEMAQATHAFIRSWLVSRYGEEVAAQTVIQYGGSMKGANAAALLGQADINGGLIGGAGLSVEAFVDGIIHAYVESLVV